MKIIQQPDILSFAGNVNDFVIEDVAKSLVFKLSVDGMVIVDEVYVAEGGEVRVSMKDIVDCFLSISIPRADSDYIIQSLAVKKFKAEIEDSVIEFTVVKGGISNVAESSAVFLKTQWLTLQPQEKRIVMHQPEYLSYYAMVACLIKMTVYFADGSANETLLALEAGNLYTVDVSYLKISSKFERAVGCYDVWIENESGQRLTYVQRYILSASNSVANVYLFENTLGGIDSVIFSGDFTEKIQTEGTVTTVLEESTDSDIDLDFSCEQNTGFIPSIDYARWLRGFFVSKQRYHVSGALRRIYLRESENGFTKNSLNDFTFEFFYSKQTKYDVVTRNRDDLPLLLEFPEVDSIPFLAPRLAEFPIAVVADDLMLPVQYAFENAWRRISIAAITQAVSDGAIDKIDLSSYWKKTELVREGLYLKFLDKYIRAKFADDSTLWDGNAFDDYLDQAVRTIDNVKFKSVISTDFESKLKGWLIDVLGNAEFRDVLLRSFKSWNFAAGPLGAGVGMVNDDEFQTDKLLVRKIMFVLEMMVQRMKFQGGIMVLSPATGFKINRVEIFDTYYRVYCRPEDVNEFEVNDQARIQNFTGGNIKYLWSLTLSKGDDYIDISRIDKDGDGVPAEGDEIVQLGNRTNPDRQDAVLLSAVNGEVGIFTYYGINSFDLSSKEGSWLGKHGEKKGAVIRGEVHITTGSSGLEQFDEYEDVDKRIQDAQNSADSVQDVVNNLISIIIPDLQGQIDGSIMSHEGTVPPTLTNEPAVNWTTEEEKNRHIGDYYDYFLTFDGEKVTERYKFSKLNGVYQWVRVADSGSALAASVAREALGLAGTKATITWGDTLPAVPYNINDVWIKTNGSMYICNHQRLEGETGSQSDWQLFNDTQLRLAQMAADNVISIEEKPSLRDTWDQIKEEFKAYQAQATKYGVSITALQNAYNTLDTFLTSTVKISQDEDTKLSVAQKTEYNQDFANYYSERTTFANVIAQKIADGAVGNIQFGMVNLLKGSNVELGAQGYHLGNYFFDKKPEVGKTYTLVTCYTLGANNTHVGAYQDGGSYLVSNFATKGDKIIESKTFKYSAPSSPNNMSFYQFPNGTHGSKVHWAVLVEGNKGPSGWVPSLADQDAKSKEIAAAEAVLAETKAKAYADGIVTEAEQNAINEAQARLDALKIGSVNLVSKKMMLEWNEKNKDIAVWGQDADGVHLAIAPGVLYGSVGNNANYNDIFLGEGKYKANTQHVFSIEWKTDTTEASDKVGLYLIIFYTDGTKETFFAASNQRTTRTRFDFVSDKGKTVQKIACSYGYTIKCRIYSLALYEGNKPLTDIPVAAEDLTGQSDVNLVDGGKENTLPARNSGTEIG